MTDIRPGEVEIALQDQLASFARRSGYSRDKEGESARPLRVSRSGSKPVERNAVSPGKSLALLSRVYRWVSLAILTEMKTRADPANVEPGDWRTPARRGAGVALLTFGVFGGWACLASIDGAVVAAGSIVVETDRKTVQHLEGGIVKDLMVTGAAHVEQGQILLRLDSNQERAKEEMSRSAVYSAISEEARLQAEAEGKDKISFPHELLEKISDPSAQRSIVDQQRRFDERRTARRIEISILEEKIAQSQRQIEGNIAQSKGASAQIDSMTQEYNKLKPLADQGIVPFARIATLERSKAEAEGKMGAYDADVERLKRNIDEARLQIEQVGQKVLEEATAKLADTRAQLGDAREKWRVATEIFGRTEVRAPRTGRIVNLKVHTIGAVIRPGDVLMEIVPDNDVLVVSARVSSLDINHVQVGLPTEVRLPSFKARSTPIAVGEVLSVAADAVRDEITHQPYYEVKVSVEVTQFPEKVREKLKPGMMADVLIATGERTVLAYLTQPMTDAIRRGMREH